MEQSEFLQILAAIIIFTITAGFSFAINAEFEKLSLVFLFSVLIISISVMTKKITANLLDSDIEHELWQMQQFGFTQNYKLKKPVPAGIIFPLIFSIISLGIIKFTGFLTYEARALKYRASKRFGFYSYTEMTDWHHALIGASGIIIVLIISLVSYLLPYNLEYLTKLSIYYAFWNLLPISKLDGAQIFFGSRVVWAILFTITLIALLFSIVIV